MATYRGDGERMLDQAVRERDLAQKVELLIDGLILHFRELEQVMTHLGIENFDEHGLRKLAEEVKKCMG